jgi:hypothetical protein
MPATARSCWRKLRTATAGPLLAGPNNDRLRSRANETLDPERSPLAATFSDAFLVKRHGTLIPGRDAAQRGGAAIGSREHGAESGERLWLDSEVGPVPALLALHEARP